MSEAGHIPRVLVFDSGVGGLSIVQALRELMPTLPLLYAADSEGFPYGVWPEQDLIERVAQILQPLMQQYRPDLLVIACNTASTIVLPTLRELFTVPVVGVVPAIKPAARLSQRRIIGLLGTPGTVARAYTAQLIQDFAADCQVIRVGSVELVSLAEARLRGQAINSQQLRAIVHDFCQPPTPDVVVLACTHFPLLRAELAAVLPESVQLIDSGAAIAARVQTLLQQQGYNLPDTATELPQIAFFTDLNAAVMPLIPALQNFGFQEVQAWPVLTLQSLALQVAS